MRAFGLRLPVVLAAMATVLAILFGLQFVVARQTISLPLLQRLRAVPGVVGEPIVTGGGASIGVEVHLALVPDLQSTYEQLRLAAGAGNGEHVSLQIDDNRSPALTADYDKLNVILDQGRATGQFVTMEQAFAAEGKALGLSRYDLVLGQTQMFLTLVAGGDYLYEVLPLTLSSTAAGGGSAS